MKPRPVIIIDTQIIGGPGRGIIQLGKVLETKGVEYRICTFEYPRPYSLEFLQEISRQGLRSMTISQRWLWDPRPFWQFLRLVKQGRFNVVQSHGYKSHLVAWFVARALGIPWLAFVHGWTKEDWKVRLYHALDRWSLQYADAVVAVSNPLGEVCKGLRGARGGTEVVLNAVDGDFIRGKVGAATIRSRYLRHNARFLIGCFGRLSHEKGQDILLRSVNGIRQQIPDSIFLFLGDGPELSRLQNLSEQLGISDRVIFHPHTETMRDYYEAIDMLILPSRSEGLPNVVLEALSFGVPVVASNVGALNEVITDGESGWLLPPGDIAALTEAVVYALSNQEQRRRAQEAGKVLMKEKFDPLSRGERIIALYDRLLSVPESRVL
jgi:glycosyltransferase involved in cell wall biosynthesis